jgi:hypothetical protein
MRTCRSSGSLEQQVGVNLLWKQETPRTDHVRGAASQAEVTQQ